MTLGQGQFLPASGQISNVTIASAVLEDHQSKPSLSSTSTAMSATAEVEHNANKSQPLPSTSTRQKKSLKSLMARAQSEMSPNTLQSLVNRVNPMRYHLGLPNLVVFNNTETLPSCETDEPAAHPKDKKSFEKEATTTLEVAAQPQDENAVPLAEEKNDSGVDSNSNSGHEEVISDRQNNDFMNTSFTETDYQGFNSFNLNDQPHPRTNSTAPTAKNITTVNSRDTGEFKSAYTSHVNEVRKDPLSATYNFHKPSRLQSLGATTKNVLTPRNSGGDNNNSNNIPEVAARIPSSTDGRKIGTPMNYGRSKLTSNHHLSASGKQRSLSSLKEKKPSAGSGWKFSSEHVQGREYLIIKQLGKGGCGEVALVIEKETRELYALKRVNLSGIGDASIEECINEVEMLVELKDSDLVVHIHSWEFSRSEKTMKIVMEHGQCDLNSSIKAINFTDLKLKFTWERILMIVDTIHKRGIVHADLKPANFVWVGDNLKIIDFGIASKLQNDHTSIPMLNPKGTLNFISPETLQPDEFGRAKISPKSDIWSLGCILYLMVYGKTPFEHVSHPVHKMNAIVKGEIEYPHLPQEFQSSATELLSVLRSCFQLDYRRRPGTIDLLRHPFLRTNSSHTSFFS